MTAIALTSHLPLAASLSYLDYTVLIVYLLATVILGSVVGRGSSSLGGYFLADRKTHWILACVSIIATDFSAISYMGVPGWVYQKDLKYALGSLLYPPVMVAVVLVFVPLFYRLKVFTVYEYLETRFHARARTITAILFLFLRGVHLAAAIYIPAVAFRTFFGIPEIWSILMIGSLTTLYTLKGGMKAVILTDFLQFVVMFGGLFVMIGILLHSFKWDVAGVWRTAGSLIAPATGTPHTTLIDLSFNLHTEATVWSLIAFYMIYNIGTYGADQVIVQRYFTMGTYREMARSILASGLLCVVTMFALSYVGILLVVYYHVHPELAAAIQKPDEVLPNYVMHTLPRGVRGLIFAALVAATMSVLSAGLNSFSTVGVMDLYRRYGKGRFATEARCLSMAKVFTLFFGVILTVVAIWVSTLHRPILEVFNELASMFIGPITGIFLLGVLTRRGNVNGVMAGAPVGLVVSFALSYWSPLVDRVNWLWIGPASCLATMLVGYLVSVLIRYAPAMAEGPTEAGLPVAEIESDRMVQPPSAI